VVSLLKGTLFRDDDEAQGVDVADSPPRYVELALEGRLPDSIDELRGLLEGREMRHLLVASLG
jgi:hypothetical protein